MVTAIALLNVKHDQVNEVTWKLADMDGVSKVYSEGVRCDLVVSRVPTHDELAVLETEYMLKLKGIQKSETLLAFPIASPCEMQGFFSIGMEK